VVARKSSAPRKTEGNPSPLVHLVGKVRSSSHTGCRVGDRRLRHYDSPTLHKLQIFAAVSLAGVRPANLQVYFRDGLKLCEVQFSRARLVLE